MALTKHRGYRNFSTIAFAAVVLATSQFSAMASSPGYLSRDIGKATAFVAERTATLAPFAHVKFCIANPDQCTKKTGPSSIDFGPGTRAKIAAINSSVNASISPQLDPPGQETWKIDSPTGSCHDYAVTKRKRLIDAGFPAAAVRLAVATTRSGEGHAVVIIRTSDGDMVLDNRRSAIVRWDRSDLRWLKIESSEDPRRWSLM